MRHDERDHGRPGVRGDDMRRWGYDPDEDLRARGVAQDERQFGGDRGWGPYEQDRRGDADDPQAPRGRPPWRGGADREPPPDAGRRFSTGAGPSADRGRGPSRSRGPGADTGYTERFEPGRQGGWLAGHDRDPAPTRDPGQEGPRQGDSGWGTTRAAQRRPGADRDPASSGRDGRHGEGADAERGTAGYGDDARPGLAGQSLYGPGDWGGRDGFAMRRDAYGHDGDDPVERDARRDGLPGGDGGYGGPTGVGGMGTLGPWGSGAGRGGRSQVTRRGGWGGYGGSGDDPAGRGDMGGFGGLAHDDEPDIDAVREPGRAQHLAAGEGGSGDWEASAAGSGQRRGPARPDMPFGASRADRPDERFGAEHYGDDRDGDDGERRQTAPGRSYGGWDAHAGSFQARWSDAPPSAGDDRGPAARDAVGRTAGERPRGPKNWRRGDDRIRDDVCERLSRERELDVADVSVDVRNGHVTLEGTVADRRTKHAIETLVDRCHGVQEIDNRIKVIRAEPARPAEAPPAPRASVPQDSPTARDEARGRTQRLTRDGSGYLG
jgi:hypothetical protein